MVLSKLSTFQIIVKTINGDMWLMANGYFGYFKAESAAESVEERPRAPDLPVIVQKNNREDVTERFGKFEIKAELESKCLVPDKSSHHLVVLEGSSIFRARRTKFQLLCAKYKFPHDAYD